MTTLLTSAAVKLVRKNMDELDPNGSAMYGETEVGSSDIYGDNQSLDSLIARNLPEAINAIHLAAPVQLLEGINHDFTRETTVSISADGVITISASPGTFRFLRLVAFQAADSAIVVTDVISEASPEGRKQLNRHIRGRADRPRLVHLQGSPTFKYFSLTSSEPYVDSITGQPIISNYKPTAISQFSYVQKQSYKEPTEQIPDQYYDISRFLHQNIIDYLTATVLETFSDQRSQLFFQKAKSFLVI